VAGLAGRFEPLSGLRHVAHQALLVTKVLRLVFRWSFPTSFGCIDVAGGNQGFVRNVLEPTSEISMLKTLARLKTKVWIPKKRQSTFISHLIVSL
jgi:hypothetical protein